MSQKDGKETTPLLDRTCPQCKTFFQTKRQKKVFCSDICRVKNWQERYPRIDPATGEPKQRAIA